MKKFIPKRIKSMLSPFVKCVANFQKRQAILNKKISLPSKRIALSYAGMQPLPGTVVSGGRVKLIHLAEVYPEQDSEFNILYLVSSALPPFARERVDACRRAGVKIVWNQNGVGYPAWAGDTYEEVNRTMKELIHKTDWVVYQSEFCKLSADEYLGKFGGPNSIVYNCVDTLDFSPTSNQLPLNPVKLLIMGSHHQPERVTLALHTLSELIKRNIQAQLKIAGRLLWPGAEVETADLIKSLSLTSYVTMAGPYLQEEAPRLYQENHILLHFKHNDPCPTVPIEAMACGLPVIASGSGGVPELLGKTGGITLEVPLSWEKRDYPTPESAADAVQLIMNDWAHWSKQARNRAVEHFDKKKWINEHQLIFDKLVTNIES